MNTLLQQIGFAASSLAEYIRKHGDDSDMSIVQSQIVLMARRSVDAAGERATVNNSTPVEILK